MIGGNITALGVPLLAAANMSAVAPRPSGPAPTVLAAANIAVYLAYAKNPLDGARDEQGGSIG